MSMMRCDENDNSVVFLPVTQNPNNHEKSMREIPIEGYSLRCLISTPQTCKGHQKQGTSENLIQVYINLKNLIVENYRLDFGT